MTLKEFQAFVNAILVEAELTEWKAVIEDNEPSYRAVSSCAPESKTIFISSVLRNRPDYEIRAAVEREVAHAKSPKKYHRKNGLLIKDHSNSWLRSKRVLALELLAKGRFSSRLVRALPHASNRR